MELTDHEKEWIEWFRCFHKTVKDPIKKKIIDKSNKEKIWIKIYTKLPIQPHVESLLFQSSVDHSSIISEMEQYIVSHLS
jgi:hypothetical protein